MNAFKKKFITIVFMVMICIVISCYNYAKVITEKYQALDGGWVSGDLIDDGEPYVFSGYSKIAGGKYAFVYYSEDKSESRKVMWSELDAYNQMCLVGGPTIVSYRMKLGKHEEYPHGVHVVISYQLSGQNEVSLPANQYIKVNEYSCVEYLIQQHIMGTLDPKYLVNGYLFADSAKAMFSNPQSQYNYLQNGTILEETTKKQPQVDIAEPTKDPKDEKKNIVAGENGGKIRGSKISSKKGALLQYDADEIIDLGCSQVAINYTLGTQSGHLEMAKKLHKKGIKITLIVTSNIPINESTLNGNPAPYNNPIFYMPDFTDTFTMSAFRDMLSDWGGIVDNYVIGNEIGDQTYCYYKPCYVEEYVKAYCNSFKKAYSAIKGKRGSAKVFIPFDQSWNMPALSKTSGRYDANLSKYKYNTREMLQLIRKELGNSMDWGVAAHPYPDPLSSAVFWDDNYASKDSSAMVVTMNNIEVMCDFLASSEMKKSDGSPREILISEIGFSDSDGDDIAAGALMYAWTKIENNNQIIGFLYNTGDFALGGDVEMVFKTMDTTSRDEAMKIMDKVINGGVDET